MSKNTTVPRSLSLSPKSVQFFRSQFTKPVLPPAGTFLAGQTAILTGGNIGLGYGCAEWFLELKLSRLILAVRTPSKGEAAAKELKKKYSGTKIEVWEMDMLSYKSIQDFVKRCETLDRLDIAILNAGKTDDKFGELTPEGHESIFQTNYLSTVFLAHLLLPVLKSKSPAGKPGRLTIVNSGTAYMAKLPHRNTTPYLPTFDDKSKFDPLETYTASKALCHFWLLKLTERVRKEDVIVNLVDPGLVKGTGLHRSMGTILETIFSIVKSLTGRTLRNGSSTFIDAAVVKGEESHGCYIGDWKIEP